MSWCRMAERTPSARNSTRMSSIKLAEPAKAADTVNYPNSVIERTTRAPDREAAMVGASIDLWRAMALLRGGDVLTACLIIK